MTEIGARCIARHLSLIQWNYLTDHVDGRRVIVNAGEEPTRVSLMQRELIQYDPRRQQTARPRETVLTELGHAVMCIVLGMMADQLIAHGIDVQKEKIGYGKFSTTHRGQYRSEVSHRARHGSDAATPESGSV